MTNQSEGERKIDLHKIYIIYKREKFTLLHREIYIVAFEKFNCTVSFGNIYKIKYKLLAMSDTQKIKKFNIYKQIAYLLYIVHCKKNTSNKNKFVDV